MLIITVSYTHTHTHIMLSMWHLFIEAEDLANIASSAMDNFWLMFVITALILFLSTLALIIFYQRKMSRNHQQLPLGSMGWPFIGETAYYISSAYIVGPDAFINKRRSM